MNYHFSAKSNQSFNLVMIAIMTIKAQKTTNQNLTIKPKYIKQFEKCKVFFACTLMKNAKTNAN